MELGTTTRGVAPLVITPVQELPASQWPDEVTNQVFWDWYLARFDHELEADS